MAIGPPVARKPCALRKAAASAEGISGSENDSGTVKAPSLTTVASMAPTLRRSPGTAGGPSRFEAAAQPTPRPSRRARVCGPSSDLVAHCAGSAHRAATRRRHEKISAVMPAYHPMFSAWVCRRSSAFSRVLETKVSTAAILPSLGLGNPR